MPPIISLVAAVAAELPPKEPGGWVDVTFNQCVEGLVALAAKLGVSYQAVNVGIFCILWPLLTLALIVTVLSQRRRIARLERSLRFAVSTKL